MVHTEHYLAKFVALLAMITAGFTYAADTDIKQGKELAWDRSRGNCLACHAMEGGDQAGNIGPPLLLMKTRFPERQVLWDRIYDARDANELTRMPPFGAHGILSKEEIDKIVAYLYSL